MSKMREEFEEWECNADTGPLTDPMWLMRDACSPENYGIVQVQHNWGVWQASRSSLEVELPKASDARNNEVAKPVGRHIISQGLKVKL